MSVFWRFLVAMWCAGLTLLPPHRPALDAVLLLVALGWAFLAGIEGEERWGRR